MRGSGGGGWGGGRGVKTNLKARTVRERFVQQKSYYCLKMSVLRLVLKAGREGL